MMRMIQKQKRIKERNKKMKKDEKTKVILRSAIDEEPNEMVTRVPKEIKEEIIRLSSDSDSRKLVKFLTDQYYQAQSFRIKAENQARAIYQGVDKEATSDYPDFIKIQIHNAKYQEALNKKYLDIATDSIPICRWMKSIKGIGPTMAAYLYSRLDPTNRYGSDFISYAGLNDNNVPWLGKEKAKALVADARKEQTAILGNLEDLISSIVGEDNLSEVKDEIIKKIKKDKVDSLDYDELELVINRVMSKKSSGYISLDDYDYDKLLLMNCNSYTSTLIHSDFATDLMYSLCSARTHRKVSLIKKGAENTYAKRNVKKSYVSVSDIESFLAKPPYNKELKTKVWLISTIFVKNKNRGSMYGKLIDQRLQYEEEKNERREYADQAKHILETKNIVKKDVIETLKDGKLTHAHLVARSMRFAVKLFISHVYEAMYYEKYHKEAPQTYVIAYMGHHDYIAPEVDYHQFLDD